MSDFMNNSHLCLPHTNREDLNNTGREDGDTLLMYLEVRSIIHRIFFILKKEDGECHIPNCVTSSLLGRFTGTNLHAVFAVLPPTRAHEQIRHDAVFTKSKAEDRPSHSTST